MQRGYILLVILILSTLGILAQSISESNGYIVPPFKILSVKPHPSDSGSALITIESSNRDIIGLFIRASDKKGNIATSRILRTIPAFGIETLEAKFDNDIAITKIEAFSCIDPDCLSIDALSKQTMNLRQPLTINVIEDEEEISPLTQPATDQARTSCSCSDINLDGSINLNDFSEFAFCFGLPPSTSFECSCSDLNLDGSINLQDFALFATKFGTQPTGMGCTESLLTTLNSPPDGATITDNQVEFSCSSQSASPNLSNVTLYGDWGPEGWRPEETKTISGNFANTTFYLNLTNGTFSWNCLTTDGENNQAYAPSNYTFSIIKPNIIVLISDDHDYELFGFTGHPSILTPNIDSLAASGSLFTEGYSTMSRCRPALASLLSGQKVHEHSIYFNNAYEPLYLSQDNVLPKLLRDSGYNTFIGGKFWEGNPADYGFTHLGNTHELFVRSGQEDVFQFINETINESKPFFMWWAPKIPHIPHTPPQEYIDLFSDEDIVVPPWINPNDTSTFIEEEKTYYAMVYWLDVSIGELMQYLEAMEQLDNTIIIFFVDNSWSNGFVSKGSPYEKGFKIPIIIKAPDAQVQLLNQFASVQDITATILDYANLPQPASYTGTSIRPLVRGEASQTYEEYVGGAYASFTLFGNIPQPDIYDDMYAIYVKKDNFKYIRYMLDVLIADTPWLKISSFYVPFPERSQGDEEFYNLQSDPYELNNVVSDPTYQSIIDELRQQADSFLISINYPQPMQSPLQGTNSNVGIINQENTQGTTEVQSCQFNIPYSSTTECVCNGESPRWSVYSDNGITCTPDDQTIYVCRNPHIDEERYSSYIPGEIIVRVNKDVSFDRIKSIIESNGGMIRLQPCNWKHGSMFNQLLVETLPGTEEQFIQQIRQTGLTSSVYKNQQVVCL